MSVKETATAKKGHTNWLLFLLGGLVALVGAFVQGKKFYRSWQRKELARIQGGGMMVETACGPVEYQVIGSGPAVLYAHGTPGGYDQGIAFSHFTGSDQCMYISPSRPGYLRTPLMSGASPEEQADLYVALLDALGIQQASIIGFSGGGPSALQFALRHPERCRGLVMMGAVIQRNDLLARRQTLSLLERLSADLVERLLVSDLLLYFAYPIARLIPYGAAVAGMLLSGAVYQLRKAGYENDLAQFAAIAEHLPLEKISVPTLVIHGTEDEDAPFADAQLLARTIPDVKLLALAGDHSAFYTYRKMVMPALRDFLTKTKCRRVLLL